jgi:hypothetical protein
LALFCIGCGTHALETGGAVDAAGVPDAASPTEPGLCDPVLAPTYSTPATSTQMIAVDGTTQDRCFGLDATQVGSPYLLVDTSVVAGTSSGLSLTLRDAGGMLLAGGGDLSVGVMAPMTRAQIEWTPTVARRNVYVSIATSDGASRTTTLSVALSNTIHE